MASTLTRPAVAIAPAPEEPPCWIGHMSAIVWAVSALPLWKVTPDRRVTVQTVKSSFGTIDSASHGRYSPVLAWRSSGSKIWPSIV